ncbi:MAG: nucleotidyltransferase family protein [Paracoccaceae bacterium]
MPPFAPETVALLILAAGSSSRMQGRDKLIEPVAGTPLLAHVIDTARATGNPVYVTLPVGANARRTLIADQSIQIIEVADADSGMSASLRAWAGSKHSKDTGVMIVLADMPDLTPNDLKSLLTVFAENRGKVIIRATGADGVSGHPIIFPHRLVHQFSNLTGDQGARSLLTSEDVTQVPLPDDHATTDLDTPEQWEHWRQTQKP